MGPETSTILSTPPQLFLLFLRLHVLTPPAVGGEILPDMREQSLTYAEAKALCANYQHLVGHALTTEPTDFSIIECVTIAPCDDVNKWIVAHNFMECGHPAENTDVHHYPFYDVILLARYKSDNSILYTDLRSYLNQRSNLDMTVEA